MSLFGALLGDWDDDPFFGGQMRRMDNMMNRMMSDMLGGPVGFGGMLGGAGQLEPYIDRSRRSHMPPLMSNALMPTGFGYPSMMRMFDNVNPENCHSYSSSTVMTMTSGPDGRPQVYQASTSMRQAPGGIREMKKSVADSRTGVKKVSIGHHIGERGHIMERQQNVYEGTAEEHQEFINLEEEEAETFNREWQRKTHGGHNAIGYHERGQGSRHQRGNRGQHLAITAPPSSSPSASPHNRYRRKY